MIKKKSRSPAFLHSDINRYGIKAWLKYMSRSVDEQEFSES
jgi:hypothetical protein